VDVEPTPYRKQLHASFGALAEEQLAAQPQLPGNLAANRPILGAAELWSDQWYATSSIVSQKNIQPINGNHALGMVVEDVPALAAAVADGERDMLLIRCDPLASRPRVHPRSTFVPSRRVAGLRSQPMPISLYSPGIFGVAHQGVLLGWMPRLL
jgi:hypothetical protein